MYSFEKIMMPICFIMILMCIYFFIKYLKYKEYETENIKLTKLYMEIFFENELIKSKYEKLKKEMENRNDFLKENE